MAHYHRERNRQLRSGSAVFVGKIHNQFIEPCNRCTIRATNYHDPGQRRCPRRCSLTVRRTQTARRPRPRPAEAQRLVDLLSSLGSTTFRQLLWQKSAELDLTYAQSQVLFYVAEHTGCHMGDVGKDFGVTLPAVTHLVDRLEEKGFVVRGEHPVDRRVYVLEPTAAGRTLTDELHALQLRGVEPVLNRMSARDRQRLMEGLEALVEAASETTGRAMDDGAQKGRRRTGNG
ncbi:MAG: MarR family winged helix-turn-helix transcriptional regulator [Candidatus Rokuibacteriota bacterium]